jgi:yecA family protein
MAHQNAQATQPDPFPERIEDEEQISLGCWTDGLVTAAAVGPRGVTIAEWMSLVWRVIEDSSETADLRAPVESLLSAMWSQTVEVMRTDPSWYMPRFMELDDQLPGAMSWADGFRAAMSLRPAAWRALFDDPENCEYVLPIALLSLDDAKLIEFTQSDRPGQLLDPVELRQELADEAADAVAGIYRYFHRRHSPPAQAVGRNAPCPCGSGRKYKKCCLR